MDGTGMVGRAEVKVETLVGTLGYLHAPTTALYLNSPTLEIKLTDPQKLSDCFPQLEFQELRLGICCHWTKSFV